MNCKFTIINWLGAIGSATTSLCLEWGTGLGIMFHGLLFLHFWRGVWIQRTYICFFYNSDCSQYTQCKMKPKTWFAGFSQHLITSGDVVRLTPVNVKSDHVQQSFYWHYRQYMCRWYLGYNIRCLSEVVTPAHIRSRKEVFYESHSNVIAPESQSQSDSYSTPKSSQSIKQEKI